MAVDNHTVDIRYGSSFSKVNPEECFYFSGMPTPYLSRSVENVFYSNKYCQLTTLNLNGQIIGSVPVSGENLNTLSILEDRKRILSGFSRSFQKLGVFENNTLIKQFEGCIVRDISFSPSNYGFQDYSITLDCYEDDEFNGTFGVLDPTDTVNFTDNKNGTVSISHSVSAKGFTTNASISSEQAIVNAKNFVEGRTGFNISRVSPLFIGGISDSNLIIQDISRDINRAEGTYSCSIDYLVQTGTIGEIPISAGHVSTIDTTVNSGVESPFVQVNVNYNLQGDKYASASSLRSSQPSTGTLFKIATGAAGIENLSSIPLNLSVDDSAEVNKSIQVSASYDSNTIYESLGTGVFFDFKVDVSTDDIKDTATVSINGDIIARGNNREQFRLKSGYYHDVVSGKLFDYANEIYTGVNYNKLYGNTAWALNPAANNLSVQMDEIAGTVSCSASFDNQDYKAGYKQFTYRVDVTPALAQYAAKPSCNENGLYAVYDLNTKTREKVNFNINSKADINPYGETSSELFLTGMHNFSNTLRSNLLGSAQDLVIESETAEAPRINLNAGGQQIFDSSISQSYTFDNDTGFY
jgi:hypothetical protein